MKYDLEAAADQLSRIGPLKDAPLDWLVAEAQAVLDAGTEHCWHGEMCCNCDARRHLADISTIANRLGVPKDTVNKWRHRGLLPEPDYPLAVGPVWEWTTIEEWAKETGRA